MISFLLIATFGHLVYGGVPGCPDNLPDTTTVTAYKGKCYQFVNEEEYWTDARDYCWRNQGDIVKYDMVTIGYIRSVINTSLPQWYNQQTLVSYGGDMYILELDKGGNVLLQPLFYKSDSSVQKKSRFICQYGSDNEDVSSCSCHPHIVTLLLTIVICLLLAVAVFVLIRKKIDNESTRSNNSEVQESNYEALMSKESGATARDTKPKPKMMLHREPDKHNLFTTGKLPKHESKERYVSKATRNEVRFSEYEVPEIRLDK